MASTPDDGTPTQRGSGTQVDGHRPGGGETPSSAITLPSHRGEVEAHSSEDKTLSKDHPDLRIHHTSLEALEGRTDEGATRRWSRLGGSRIRLQHEERPTTRLVECVEKLRAGDGSGRARGVEGATPQTQRTTRTQEEKEVHPEVPRLRSPTHPRDPTTKEGSESEGHLRTTRTLGRRVHSQYLRSFHGGYAGRGRPADGGDSVSGRGLR